MNNNQPTENKSNIQDLLRPNNATHTDNIDMALWNIQPQPPKIDVQPVKQQEVPQPPKIEKNKQPKQKKKTPLSTIILFVICICAIVYGIYFTFFRTKANDKKDNEVYIEEEKIKIDREVSLSWNGVYTSTDKKVVIYMYDDYTINVDLKIKNSMYGFYATAENLEENKIVYEHEEFGETISIIIEKTETGVSVTASSTDKKDSLNLAGGNYTKNKFKELGWTGTYTNDNTTIILNEIDTNYILCNIIKDSYISSFNFDSMNASELNYLDDFDKGTVKITKSATGITVEAQSRRDGDIFNEISGTYKKS